LLVLSSNILYLVKAENLLRKHQCCIFKMAMLYQFIILT